MAPLGPATDAIAAIATPAGRGGVGIVRVSGAMSRRSRSVVLGRTPTPRRATFAMFRGARGEPLDEGLALFFPAPASYTGETVLELQGHGSPAALKLVLARCLELGARLAAPGEFTRRAFLNGKLDLAQAESVADLIDAATSAAARAAARVAHRRVLARGARAGRRGDRAAHADRGHARLSRRGHRVRARGRRGRTARLRLANGSSGILARAAIGARLNAGPRRRAGRPAQRRQVEPPQSTGTRGGGDRHAGSRHDARHCRATGRGRRHPGDRGRHRGTAVDGRCRREDRHRAYLGGDPARRPCRRARRRARCRGRARSRRRGHPRPTAGSAAAHRRSQQGRSRSTSRRAKSAATGARTCGCRR